MKNRLLINWVTTLLGVLFLVVALYQWTKGATKEEVALIAGYGLIFLRSKDSLIGIGQPVKLPLKNDE
jgi:hypothetical protein